MIVHIRNVQAALMPPGTFTEAKTSEKSSGCHRCSPGRLTIIYEHLFQENCIRDDFSARHISGMLASPRRGRRKCNATVRSRLPFHGAGECGVRDQRKNQEMDMNYVIRVVAVGMLAALMGCGQAEDPAAKAAEQAKAAAASSAEAAQSATDAAAAAVTDEMKSLDQASQDAMDATADQANAVADQAAAQIDAAGSAVSDAASDAGDAMGDAMQGASDKMQDAADKMKQ
jgi:hypothetical protein